MFKWLGKMFASDKVVQEGITLIDKAFYTEQEEATDKQLAIDKKDALILNWLEASKGANIARRFLAVFVALVWGFFLAFSWLSQQIAVWSGKVDAEKIRLMNEINQPFLDQLTGAQMLVLGFYFAAPFMGDIAKGAMAKFGGGK